MSYFLLPFFLLNNFQLDFPYTAPSHQMILVLWDFYILCKVFCWPTLPEAKTFWDCYQWHTCISLFLILLSVISQSLIAVICCAYYLVYSLLQWWSLSPPSPWSMRNTFPGVFHKHIVTSSFTSENTFKMLIRHCPVVATTYLFHVLISYSKIRNPVLISVRIKMKVRRLEVSRKQTFETVLKGEAVATMSKLSRLQTASDHWPHLSIAKIYEARQHCLEGLSSITVRTVEG